MKLKELRKETKENLLEQLKKKRIELADKKIMFSIGKEKNTNLVKNLKKDIAQLLTIINEKEVLNDNQNS